MHWMGWEGPKGLNADMLTAEQEAPVISPTLNTKSLKIYF